MGRERQNFWGTLKGTSCNFWGPKGGGRYHSKEQKQIMLCDNKLILKQINILHCFNAT